MNYVTCITTIPEGIGSLLQYILSCYYLSKYYDLKFVYTPINNFEHMSWDGFTTQKDWDNMWNDYIINIFLPRNEVILIDEVKDKNTVLNSLNFQEYKNTLFILNDRYMSKIYLDRYINVYPYIMDKLRDNYILKNNIISYFNKPKINIAVHIRRYTNTDCDNSGFRELYFKGGETDLYFYSLMLNLIELLKCKERQIEFHIFTQLSETEDNTIFEHYFNLINENVQIYLHKGYDTKNDLYHMSTANILLLSKSSFSAIANYYSKGISIIKNSFHHTLRSNTIFVNSEGSINDLQKEYILNNI